jgi:hypothetical protein
MEKEMNLYERIQAVSMEVMNLEKDKTVGEGKTQYKAVSDQQVILAVKQAEKTYGIISIPIKQEMVSSEVVRFTKDGYDKLNYVDVVKMTVRISIVSDPTQFVDVESFGRGLDAGDKGLGKASTYARKYALLNAYKIATGEDPDMEKSKDEKIDIGIDEIKLAVQNYANKDNKYLQSILKNFNVGNFDDLTKEQIKITYDTLKQKNLL